MVLTITPEKSKSNTPKSELLNTQAEIFSLRHQSDKNTTVSSLPRHGQQSIQHKITTAAAMSSARERQKRSNLPSSNLVSGTFRTFPPQFNVTSQASNPRSASLSNLSSVSQPLQTLLARSTSMQPWLGPTPSSAPTVPKGQRGKKKEKKSYEGTFT